MITTALAVLAIGAQGAPSINQFVQGNLRDATFTARILRSSQSELKKIKNDFGTSYRFGSTTISYKEPMKLRVEANVEDTRVLMIENGPTQWWKVPRTRLSTKENLAMKPGRRQTPVDFGLLTPSVFDGLFEARFVRWDRASGDAVFDLTYITRLDDTTRHRVWIDPQKKIINKREWYSQEGRQLATFYYESPKQIAGVWLPTRLTVKNVENNVAGVTTYDSIRVNSGLADSLFQG